MSQVFTLEALRAGRGDSLLLHYGAAEAPKLMIIDGGPSGTYKRSLAPRLEQLRLERELEELVAEVVMISHIDSDHIHGILDLARDLEDHPEKRGQLDVKTLWLNAFEHALGEGAVAELTEALAEVPAGPGATPSALGAVIASVGEGIELADFAERLGWPSNRPFDELVMAPEGQARTVDFDDMALTNVAPLKTEVEALRDDWENYVKKLKAEIADGHVADYSDPSVYNLSSMVCLAELGDKEADTPAKKMLLTGDARGDLVLAGLANAELLAADGSLELDLLKVPHHGSSRNLTEDFFRALPADDYVISANGHDDNPDLETLEMLFAANHERGFRLHLTYSDWGETHTPVLQQFFAERRAAGADFELLFPADDAYGLAVDLLSPLSV